MNDLKERLLKELADEVEKDKKRLEKLEISRQAAILSKDKSANEEINKYEIFKQRSIWKKEMISKYK